MKLKERQVEGVTGNELADGGKLKTKVGRARERRCQRVMRSEGEKRVGRGRRAIRQSWQGQSHARWGRRADEPEEDQKEEVMEAAQRQRQERQSRCLLKLGHGRSEREAEEPERQDGPCGLARVKRVRPWLVMPICGGQGWLYGDLWSRD